MIRFKKNQKFSKYRLNVFRIKGKYGTPIKIFFIFKVLKVLSHIPSPLIFVRNDNETVLATYLYQCSRLRVNHYSRKRIISEVPKFDFSYPGGELYFPDFVVSSCSCT